MPIDQRDQILSLEDYEEIKQTRHDAIFVEPHYDEDSENYDLEEITECTGSAHTVHTSFNMDDIYVTPPNFDKIVGDALTLKEQIEKHKLPFTTW